MTLTNEEYIEFLETHLNLLLYVGREKGIVSSNYSMSKFRKRNMAVKFECRQALHDDPRLLEAYLTEHGSNLPTNQLETLAGFKKKIMSDFIIFKCLENHAIFIDAKDNQFYAVKALSDPFDIFFDEFPAHISTILLPFKNKIIYDGFMQSSNIYFGRNITHSLNDSYKQAKKNKAIVESMEP